MLLAPIAWAHRVWALPVLTALAPSERHDHQRGRRHKALTDHARQLLRQVSRWLPGRELVMVADSSFSALEFLNALAPRMSCITRLRLDARLFAPPPPRQPGRPGRPALKGARLPTLASVLGNARTRWQRVMVPAWYGLTARPIEIFSGCAVWQHPGLPVVPLRWVLIRDPLGRFDPQALLCTNQNMAPLQVVLFFIRRWQLEVTFEEARRHLGLETQRQWSVLAIARTTPVLLGLFWLVTLLANTLARNGHLPMRQAAWYTKTTPTFSDALAAVRAHWWRAIGLATSRRERDMIKVPRSVFRRLHEACLLCRVMAKVELRSLAVSALGNSSRSHGLALPVAQDRLDTGRIPACARQDHAAFHVRQRQPTRMRRAWARTDRAKRQGRRFRGWSERSRGGSHAGSSAPESQAPTMQHSDT